MVSKNMFEEFWEKRKNLIQFIGALIAIGAIFLTIDLPENQIAMEALINVQFLWLFIITLSICIFGFIFVSFMYQVSHHLEKRLAWDTSSFIGVTSFIIFFNLIISLWRYMLALYGNEWEKTMRSISILVPSVIYLSTFEIITRIYKKYPDSIPKRLFFSCLVILPMSTLSFLWNQLKNLHFKGEDFLKSLQISLLINFVIYLVVLCLNYFVLKKTTKKHVKK